MLFFVYKMNQQVKPPSTQVNIFIDLTLKFSKLAYLWDWFGLDQTGPMVSSIPYI